MSAWDTDRPPARQSSGARTRPARPGRTGRIFVSETTELLDTPATETRPRKASGGLSGMVLVDLKALAGQLGIKGTSGMRKGDLVAAITARQSANSGQQYPRAPHPRRPRPPTAPRSPASSTSTCPPGRPRRPRGAGRRAARPAHRRPAAAGTPPSRSRSHPRRRPAPTDAPQGAESTDQPTGTEREPADGDRGDAQPPQQQPPQPPRP